MLLSCGCSKMPDYTSSIAVDIVKNNAIHLVFIISFFLFYNLFISLQKWHNITSWKRKINFLSHPITKYMKSFIHQSRSMYKLNVHKNLLMCTVIKSNRLYCILKAMSSYNSNRFPRSRCTRRGGFSRRSDIDTITK